MKVLVSAFACAPGAGSEPGVGWGVVTAVAREHMVWVLTRSDNQVAISEYLKKHPETNLQFVFFDVGPPWLVRAITSISSHLRYYLWQVAAYFVARRLQRTHQFHVVHHLTYASYWRPTLMGFLGIPFLWGPVGGGESAPKGLRKGLSIHGQLYEWLRTLARQFGEYDPLVKAAARSATIGLASTIDTAERMRRLGCLTVRVQPNVALGIDQSERLLRGRIDRAREAVRFISVGRLLDWKGFHIGLKAFAKAGTGEYWIVGDGPARGRLERLARALGLKDRVRFLGHMDRKRVLDALAASDVLVHPSLHDSGGFVVVEAMVAGLAVVCLDMGGPSTLVGDTGVRVHALDHTAAVQGIAEAMHKLASDPDLRLRLGQLARSRALNEYTWEAVGGRILKLYSELAGK